MSSVVNCLAGSVCNNFHNAANLILNKTSFCLPCTNEAITEAITLNTTTYGAVLLLSGTATGLVAAKAIQNASMDKKIETLIYTAVAVALFTSTGLVSQKECLVPLLSIAGGAALYNHDKVVAGVKAIPGFVKSIPSNITSFGKTAPAVDAAAKKE